MKFIYEIISSSELTQTEKVILALKDEEFFFLRSNGVLKINAAMPRLEELVKIGKDMWEFDRLLDSDEAEIMDGLWQKVKKIAGKDAATQLDHAWSEALQEKLDAEDKQAAAEWLGSRNIPDELDAICDIIGSYHPGFVKALWRQTTSTDAILLYGYQLGLQAAGKVVAV